ncbi:MAG: ABC transporter ATP-binding protein [Actinomycetia bacterium]|nr:ABC transporter ATP-binding protein [Actinomycetes bacterium]
MLLEVKDLRVQFVTRRGVVKAVDGVSFSVERGETLGLVGESGSGKSVSCLALMRLVEAPAGRIMGGSVLLEGEELLDYSEREMRQVRGGQISLILQDPLSSLNPAYTIGNQVAEAIRIHQGMRGKELTDSVVEILTAVGIPQAEQRLKQYPHQMSGGMRQRVAGAIALSCRPSLLIADEPTTSLDATVQAQYLRLLSELQEKFQFGMIFVTHDLGIVARLCDRVAVMYAGRIVETGSTRQIFNEPAHPYAKALLATLPSLDSRKKRLLTVTGQPPIPINLPPGCSFAPRCPEVMDVCRETFPSRSSLGDQHGVLCWLHSSPDGAPSKAAPQASYG